MAGAILKKSFASLLTAFALVAIGACLWWFVHRAQPEWVRPAPLPGTAVVHSRGGSVRVAVSTPPELSDTGSGGNTLRQLVYPKLFVARPDGKWVASTVEPGSDHGARNGKSASFRLRTGARWSNGAAITADDLRRTMDKRFVKSIDGPDNQGRITVRFIDRLIDWRRLWSGADSIAPPSPDTYGGPFVVRSVASGLETVLARNDSWIGAPITPYLDEVRLVLVSDSVTAKHMLASGQIDVVVPADDTVRTDQYSRLSNVAVDVRPASGEVVALRLNPNNVPESARRRLLALFQRERFVNSLLRDEATVVYGLDGQDVWRAGADAERTHLEGIRMTVTAPADQPLMTLLAASLQRSVVADHGALGFNVVDTSTLNTRVGSGEYDAVVEVDNDGPKTCWTCHWADVDSVLARRADGGDTNATVSLERRLREHALYFPLWRGKSVAAWRNGVVNGVSANGFSPGVAWNAELWWRS